MITKMSVDYECFSNNKLFMNLNNFERFLFCDWQNTAIAHFAGC